MRTLRTPKRRTLTRLGSASTGSASIWIPVTYPTIVHLGIPLSEMDFSIHHPLGFGSDTVAWYIGLGPETRTS